jgi:hypothetical protein
MYRITATAPITAMFQSTQITRYRQTQDGADAGAQ